MADNPAPLRAHLVLTRPAAQSRALTLALGAALDAVEVVIAPILEIVCTGAAPLPPGTGVVLTSANAVRCGPALAGVTAHCVGATTAQAARAAGADVRSVAQNADALVGAVTGPGPLVHLRGAHARGQVAARLTRAGTPTAEAVVYRQDALPLSAAAHAALTGPGPAILPLFSPRSARLVGARLVPGPRLRVIAMSEAVAVAWAETTGGTAGLCPAPTGAAMRAEIVAALRRLAP